MDGGRQKVGTIAVALSGGLDSAVAAALLRERGHEVIGLTARMWAEGADQCPSKADYACARRIAARLGMAHHSVDLREAFHDEVVDSFVAEYARGRTPSPCIVCNRAIKFGRLLEEARRLGAERLATGHYARLVRERDGLCRLFRGMDEAKDQSYFLFGLSQAQLQASVFPLGEERRTDVVAYASTHGLGVPAARSSQDLCFASSRGYRAILERERPDLREAGEVVDMQGKVLGAHEGIHEFTVGQRGGLGIALGKPMYVVRIEPATNRVVVGAREDAMSRCLELRDPSWMLGRPPDRQFAALTRIRASHREAASHVRARADGSVLVEFEEPQFAVTPGQAAVFYAPTGTGQVLGGGWIEGVGNG